jgi:hypothetical protein
MEEKGKKGFVRKRKERKDLHGRERKDRLC